MLKPASSCSGHLTHCVTCSDEAIRGRVLKTASGGMAIVAFDDGDLAKTTEEVSLELVEAAPGDIVLVHAKIAIARLGSSEEARGGNYE